MSQVGSLVFTKIATKTLIGETNTDLSTDANAIDVSNKLSGRYTNVEYGRMNTTIAVTNVGSSTPSATLYDYQTAKAAMAAGTKVAVTVTKYTDETAATPVTGDIIWSGTCIITNVSWSSGDDAAQTFSMSLQLDGEDTVAVNGA